MASDSFKSFRSNSSSKSTKQAIRKCVGVAAATDSSSSSSSSDSEPDAEMKSPPSKRKKPLTIWKKKIRVICTDPDATESSSNEEEEEEVEDVILPKRLVREILIPSDCCAFPSISESSGSDRLCHNSNGINYLQAKTEEIPVCMKKEERLICRDPGMGKNVMAMMPDCAKKSSSSSSSRRANAHKASAAGKCNGARQRQRRKWSAEIRDPRKGIRIWLGTCYSFEEEVAKTCDSASSRKIDCRPQSQMEILPDSELSPYPCSNARHASDSVHLSDHKDAGRSSFLDCPNAEEEEEEVFGLIKSSSIKENMAPISSCYSGFGSLSPSSVLENAAPDDCQSPNFLNADQKVSNCADAYIDESSSAVSTGMQSDLVTSNMVDQIMANSGPMHSQLKLDSGTFVASNSLLSASSYPLLEESQYYGDFSQIFNVSRSYSEPLDHHLDVEIFANDGFSDVDFDNETETLAWINVAEV